MFCTPKHELVGHLYLEESIPEVSSQVEFSAYSTSERRRTPYLEERRSGRVLHLQPENELEGHLILRKVSQKQQSGRVLAYSTSERELEGHLILKKVRSVLHLFNLRTEQDTLS
ncbi:hypothetical protein CEXT_132501 [Caerostris extrusa]|uniref:Uncharacterized protein n=1 Tax=Caerostris extrusa TaxID=172846 RepID=A0AAV4Y7A7_CAEEX|nr:hypothetical protein CEXT_132501 [Caerostris extrusa]